MAGRRPESCTMSDIFRSRGLTAPFSPTSKTEIQRAAVEIPEVEYRVRVSFESFARAAHSLKRNRERGDAETPAPPSTSDFPGANARPDKDAGCCTRGFSRISYFPELRHLAEFEPELVTSTESLGARRSGADPSERKAGSGNDRGEIADDFRGSGKCRGGMDAGIVNLTTQSFGQRNFAAGKKFQRGDDSNDGAFSSSTWKTRLMEEGATDTPGCLKAHRFGADLSDNSLVRLIARRRTAPRRQGSSSRTVCRNPRRQLSSTGSGSLSLSLSFDKWLGNSLSSLMTLCNRR